jgi:hypothetical protein
LTAMFGQNGLACVSRVRPLWDWTSTTASSAVKLAHTKPYVPSGENIVIPGPFASGTRRVSLAATGSITDT